METVGDVSGDINSSSAPRTPSSSRGSKSQDSHLNDQSSPLTELSSTPAVISPCQKVCTGGGQRLSSRIVDHASFDEEPNLAEDRFAIAHGFSHLDYAPNRLFRKRKAPDLYISARAPEYKRARRSSPQVRSQPESARLKSTTRDGSGSSSSSSPIISTGSQSDVGLSTSSVEPTPVKLPAVPRKRPRPTARTKAQQEPTCSRIVHLAISRDRLAELSQTLTASTAAVESTILYFPSTAYLAPYFATGDVGVDGKHHELQTFLRPEDEESYGKLLQVSKAIMMKTPLDQKPEPVGRPEVWADSRQALCETVLYYQAWQGACYMSKGVLYSFMFDNNGHSRDLLDSDVVVARAGGCMTRDRMTQDMIQTKDQKDNGQSQAVRAAIAQQNPIAIFCGSENTDVPTRMPHRYCSLGWFKATHAWSDKTWTKTGEARENIKYRFEKLDTSSPSWWTPIATELPATIGTFDPAVKMSCIYCQNTHQQVYLEGWMCLNSECCMFWRLWNGYVPHDHDLNYDPRFLKQKTFWPSEATPYDLRPQLPDPSARMGDDVTYAMTRGICCPRCGKCTSRYLLKGWICSNPECDFTHFPPHVTITARSIRDPWHPVSAGISQSHDYADREHISTTVSVSHNYRIVTYRVPGIDGHITHLIANKTVNEESRGPDEMFEALQTLDAGLERRRFCTGKEEFMTAFSANFGMPYRFVASVDSKPFTSAPWPITETRSRLNWAAAEVVGPSFKSRPAKEGEAGVVAEGRAAGFNELLAIAYFDGQNIKYHDDGEYGLGETVASLSLGQPADMWFRVKAKHFCGVSKAVVFTDARPLPGTMRYHDRLVAWEKFQQGGKDGNAGGHKRLVELGKQLGLSCNVKDRKPWIRLRLSHGDVVVMHGRQVQEYLEHQVDPLGKLRFALTCRTILEGHLKAEEMPGYEVEPDDGHYDGSGIAEMKA